MAERKKPTGLLHQPFEEQARERPDARAVISPGGKLTYGELNARANRLAELLRARGVGPDRLVGISLHRSPELLVAILAVLKAGGAWVPLDPTYPRDYLAFEVEDAALEIILTKEEHRERLPDPAESGASLVSLESVADELAKADSADPVAAAAPDHLAYVIYTSGSSGRPKGVLVTHRGIVRTMVDRVRNVPFTATDRLVQVFPCAFDASVCELFAPLWSGAALILVAEGEQRDNRILLERAKEFGATGISMIPTQMDAFLDEPDVGDLSSLTHLLTGGEELPPALLAKFMERIGRRLYYFYGATEVSVDATMWVAEPGPIPDVVPIGKAVAGKVLRVLDEDRNPVPAGDPGELYIGGAGLARGYLNRDDLTRERFLPDPDGDGPDARMYRTGDLVRELPDGHLVFLGRADHQVKLDGHRIEPGEIEAALAWQSGIREAAVVLREDPRPGAADRAVRRLVAYLRLVPGEPEDPGPIRNALRDRLPAFKVPAAFFFLNELPHLPNGKVDRRALLALPAPATADPPGLEDAESPLEEFLTELWRTELGVDRIGRHDNFFDLGGGSIQAAVITTRLQEKLGRYVYVVAVYDAPTVAGLAEYLRTHYAREAEREFGGGGTVEGEPGAAGASRLTREKVEHLTRLIEVLPHREHEVDDEGPKNPPAIFVLSPPRSGSTLIRILLGGHPALFSPPELQLLSFHDLAERRKAFELHSFWLEATIRAIMEIRGCEVEQARRIMAECEAENLTTRAFYGRLQEWIGDRRLVDKTPFYVLDPGILRRMETYFTDPLYIHLVRHPLGMIRSFEEARLHVFFKLVLKREHTLSSREFAEAIWQISHRNIVDFLAGVPAERQHRISFEDMVSTPRESMGKVADFLGLEFHPDMIDPYTNLEHRMTDGIHPLSRMLGDVKFHTHRKISSASAWRWKRELSEDVLGEDTRALAVEIGYEPETTPPVDSPFCEGWEPGFVIQQGGGTPLFLAHGIGGESLHFYDFARYLGAERTVYGLRAPPMSEAEAGDPDTLIARIAGGYNAAVKRIQPTGPYYLAGYSAGAQFALEMAQQLRAAGEEVALLVSFDHALTNVPTAPGDRLAGVGNMIANFPHWLVRVFKRKFSRNLRSWTRSVKRHFRRRVLRKETTIDEVIDMRAWPKERRQLALLLHRALTRYRPRPYDGLVVLFRARRQPLLSRFTSRMGWDRIARRPVELHVVPGAHREMFEEPDVRVLAETLAPYLPPDEVESTGSHGGSPQ